jgi:RNA polymerase sigma-70 factor, ECF subfamily
MRHSTDMKARIAARVPSHAASAPEGALAVHPQASVDLTGGIIRVTAPPKQTSPVGSHGHELRTAQHGCRLRRTRTSRPGRPSASADEELLGIVVGDPSTLGPLYGRYANLVYGVALAMLGSREEAEDLTQEVFVAICEPTAYDPERGTVSAFLITMTRSRAIDRLRRRSRSARLLKTWHEASPPALAPLTPFERVSMRRTAERVRAVLAELPRAERQVLELAYYGGLSQWEIASHLDTPLGTVKSRLRRALIKLERVLTDLTG